MLKKDNLLSSLAIILLAIVYFLGLHIHIMEVDAAQYASISLEMLQTGEFLQVKHQGQNYLDKPPLLFWLSALFFKIFGVSTLIYKLPSVLFTVFSFYAVYRFTKLIYNKKTGLLAALILATSQAYFLFNNDIRTDTLLAASVAFALWFLQEYRANGKLKYFIGAFIAIAFAMLSKGPIGLMVPVIAFSFDFAWNRQWKMFLKWQWLAGITISFIILLPMLYGLYTQYGWYGWKFFFWLQSFGRITGENTWKNDDSPSAFFLHTLLWTFAPWSLMLLAAVIQKIRSLFKTNTVKVPEIMTLTGVIIPIIILSFSHYKLPHYIFVVYPLAAVLSANYITSLNIKWLKFWQWITGSISAILIIVSVLILFYVFKPINFLAVFLWMLGLTGFIFTIFKTTGVKKLALLTAFGAITVNLVLNGSFYPQLLKYQSSTQASIYLNNAKIPQKNTALFSIGSHAFNFHRQTITPLFYTMHDIRRNLEQEKYLWIFTTKGGYNEIAQTFSRNIKDTVQFHEFSVAFLNFKILDPETRPEVLSKRYLIKLEK